MAVHSTAPHSTTLVLPATPSSPLHSQGASRDMVSTDSLLSVCHMCICRLEENEQIRTRLEVEALQMADELDIARC